MVGQSVDGASADREPGTVKEQRQKGGTSRKISDFPYSHRPSFLMDPIRSSVYNVCASSPVVVSHANTTTKRYNKNTDCKYTDSNKLLIAKRAKYHRRLE